MIYLVTVLLVLTSVVLLYLNKYNANVFITIGWRQLLILHMVIFLIMRVIWNSYIEKITNMDKFEN